MIVLRAVIETPLGPLDSLLLLPMAPKRSFAKFLPQVNLNVYKYFMKLLSISGILYG